MKRYTSSIAVAALILAGGIAANAQDTAQGQAVPTAAAPTGEAEEIIVTGTRIKRQDVVANSPVAIVGSEEIQYQAAVNLEEVVREMPQALPGVSAGVNNGNPGAATVNLRGLDDERTLVLINGKRTVGYDEEGIVDLNNIPTSLIERVDVVTGGASAVYGSDAIAGVVNFILKDDFEGVQVDYDYVNLLRGGERTHNIGVTVGGNFAEERGNATVYVGWTDRQAVVQGDRWFSEASLNSDSGTIGGSSTDTNGNVACGGCFYSGAGGPTSPPGADSVFGFTPDGDLIPRGARRFNFNPYNYLQVPESRYQAMALAHYDLNEWVRVYGRAWFAQTEIDAQLAPSGVFINGDPIQIPFDSIFLSQQGRDVLFRRPTGAGAYGLTAAQGWLDGDLTGVADGVVGPGDSILVNFGRRTLDVGPRQQKFRTMAYEVLGGVEGDIPGLEGWSYDISLQHGRTELSEISGNDVTLTRVQHVLDSGSPTVNPGAVDGGSCGPDLPGGCVVGNLFGDGNLNADAGSYISLALNKDTYTEQDVVQLSASGDLGETIKIPGASPIGTAFGFDWRRVSSDSNPDDCYRTPGCSGGFGSTQPVSFEFTVYEFYGEVLMPILEDKPFAKSLMFESGYRWANYSHAGSVDAYKVGGEYSPIEGLKFRTLFQRAVRAPNILEFAQPISSDLDNSRGDPCAGYAEANGGTPLPIDQFTRDLCVQTGVPATAFTPAGPGVYTTSLSDIISGQINILEGGNSELKPEESDTLTVGGIWEPTFLEGLVLQIDWYRVEIENAISNYAADNVLDGCYLPANNPSGDPLNQFCQFVNRDTFGTFATSLDGIIETEQNIAILKVEGIDFQVNYALDLGNMGAMDIYFTATRLMTKDDQPAVGIPVNHCKGKYGAVCDSPASSVRFSQRTTWHLGDFDFGYRWRFLRGTDYEAAGQGIWLPDYESISDTHYVDLLVGWTPSDVPALEGFIFQIGLENIFDEDPPIVGADIGTTDQNSANTWPGTFDSLGRALTISATKKF